MLSQITLDDERFSDIVETSRKQIPGLYPEWTDYNYHDPGITMIELFAWMKEMQQFYLDQIGQVHIRKYFSLMGIRPQNRMPAKAEVELGLLTDPLFLAAGSRFYAGDICFEAIEPRWIGTAEIRKLISISKGPYGRRERRETPVTENKMRFLVFGGVPEAGAEFRIGLDGPLPVKERQSISLHLYYETGTRRNPVGEHGMIEPLAKLSLAYLGGQGYQEVSGWKDMTHQLLEDGAFTFIIGEEMKPGEDGMYWLRLTLEQSNYDLPPVLEHIGIRQIRVRQTETLSEYYDTTVGIEKSICMVSRLARIGEYMLFVNRGHGFYQYEGKQERVVLETCARFTFPDLVIEENEIVCRLLCFEAKYYNKLQIGVGTGMPNQEYDIAVLGLCAEGLAVMAETQEGSGCYEIWDRCEDFCASHPSDRHFQFEEESNVLIFGDCEHGMAPEGRILLAAGHTSLGSGGNVKAQSIVRFDGNSKDVVVGNQREAAGGRAAEDIRQCSERLACQLHTIKRAVTYGDYEYLAKETPGLLIENVRAIPLTKPKRQDKTMQDDTISIVVKPYSREKRPHLSSVYRKNIQHMLEPGRMIGTRINILSPEYTGVTVFAEIKTNGYDIAAKESVYASLEQYFDGIRAVFGPVVQYSAVYGSIDVLEMVTGIKSLSIDAQGRNIRRSRNGDLILPVNGLAYLKEWNCIILTDR